MRSTKDVALSTKYTITILRNRAMIMLMVSNSARKESKVVNEPAPAISGKAIGTMDAPEGESCLKSSTPNIISKAIKAKIKEPAKANEDISTPKRPSSASPTNRKTIMMVNAIEVA